MSAQQEDVIKIRLEAENDAYKKAFKEADRAVTDHGKTVEETSKVLAKQRQQLSQNITEIQKEIVVLKQAETADRALISQKSALVAALRNEKQALDLKSKALKEASANTVGASTALGTMLSSLTGIAGALGIATTAVGAFATAVKGFNQAVEFQKTINTIKAVGEATTEEMAIAKKAIQEYGASTIFTSQEVAEAFKEMVKGGLSVGQSLKALPGVLDAAAASGDGLQRSSEVIVGSLRSFGLEASKAAHVADVLAQGDAKASTSISELGEAIKYVGPVAAASNQTLEETVAILAFLSNKMIKAGDAGTDLTAILVRLQNPPAEAAAALKTLGVQITDTQGKIRPAIDIFIDMQKAIKGFNQISQTKLLSDISGLNNLKSLQKLANGTSEELLAMREAIQSVDGVAKKMADTIQDGAVGAISEMTGAWDAAMLSFGEGLANALLPLILETTNLIKRFQDLSPVTESLASIFVSLFSTLGNVYASINSLWMLMTEGVSIGDSLRLAIGGTVVVVDTLAVSVEAVSLAILGLIEMLTGGGFTAAKNRLDQIGDSFNALGQRTKNLAGVEDPNGFGSFTRVSDLPSIGGGTTRPTGGRNYTGSGSGKKKGKKGPSAESLERAAVGDQKDALSAALANVALAARGAVADLGPYSSELAKLQIKQKANTDEAKVYIDALAKLRTLSGKTVDGQKERNKAIADTTRALKENGIESKETANQIRKLTDDQQKATDAYDRNLRLVRSQNSTEATKNTQLFQLEELEKAFAQNQITAQEYYDERLAWIERNANIEKTALLFEKGLLQEELEALGDGNETLERRRAIYLEIEKIQGRQVALEQKRESDRENLNTKAKESAQEISDNLRDQTKNGLSEAISTVLKGGKVTDALKQFAQTLRDAIINALANALAERLVKGFQSLFDKFGAFTSKIAGNSPQTQLNPISALSGQLGTGGGLAVPQQQASGGGGGFINSLGSLFGGKPKASATAGGGTTASVGKLSGFLGKAGAGFGGGAIGAGIGQAVGSKTNKAVGAITGALGGALAGAAFGGPIGAAVGALVGGIGALFGGGNGKKEAQKQAKFDRFDAGLAKIQGSTDTNNLDSIYNSLLKITKLFKKEGGSRNLGVANQYIAQLKQAQEERKKAIAAFIKDSAQANLAVQTEIDKLGKSSAEQLFLSNKAAISGLANERDKALEAYKDSEEAKTKILENYTLQRELIAKQEVEAYKENVETLGDLLKNRDEIVNSNFFKRRQTLEQKKAADLSAVDSEIAQALKDLQTFQANGVAVPNDLKNGLASLLAKANSAGISTVQLDVVINESTNAAETQKLIETAFDSFLRSLGANAA